MKLNLRLLVSLGLLTINAWVLAQDDDKSKSTLEVNMDCAEGVVGQMAKIMLFKDISDDSSYPMISISITDNRDRSVSFDYKLIGRNGEIPLNEYSRVDLNLNLSSYISILPKEPIIEAVSEEIVLNITLRDRYCSKEIPIHLEIGKEDVERFYEYVKEANKCLSVHERLSRKDVEDKYLAAYSCFVDVCSKKIDRQRQRELDASSYSGFVDKSKLYELGQYKLLLRDYKRTFNSRLGKKANLLNCKAANLAKDIMPENWIGGSRCYGIIHYSKLTNIKCLLEPKEYVNSEYSTGLLFEPYINPKTLSAKPATALSSDEQSQRYLDMLKEIKNMKQNTSKDYKLGQYTTLTFRSKIE